MKPGWRSLAAFEGRIQPRALADGLQVAADLPVNPSADSADPPKVLQPDARGVSGWTGHVHETVDAELCLDKVAECTPSKQ